MFIGWYREKKKSYLGDRRGSGISKENMNKNNAKQKNDYTSVVWINRVQCDENGKNNRGTRNAWNIDMHILCTYMRVYAG